MSSDLVERLCQELDSKQHYFAELARYADGTQELAFISPESRKALGNRLSRMSVGIPALAVQSLGERLRVSGFSDPRAWQLFTQSDLDQLAPQAISDALTFGCGYVLVWAKDGKPVATVESPRHCAVLRDPADRSVVAGIKRYRTDKETHVWVYLADRIEHHVANTPGAATAGFELKETIEHSLGVVPLVPIDNNSSEIEPLIPLVDAYNKILTDMLVSSETAGRPRRWISGLELVEKPVLDDDGNPVVDDDGEPVLEVVSPIEDTDNVMVSENHETKFGQLPETDLGGFEAGVKVIISAIQAVSSLPAHYLGVLQDQPSSADALRASEAALTAKAEARQLRFGRGFELVGRLLLAIDSGVDVAGIALRVKWALADTRSLAQEADATVKLHQAGLISRSTALSRLGYSEDEIERERALIRAESLDTQGITFGSVA